MNISMVVLGGIWASLGSLDSFNLFLFVCLSGYWMKWKSIGSTSQTKQNKVNLILC